ncbi:glycosyltransferase [Draconibacterium orientale]|uniref:glycosyltransferase n=1 Tax=Draconibacterium orientale TaxID=1168034 RepID=UPI0029C06C21|nr:glycosyltransferase [Draconibacterium orientale]
MNVLMFGWEFPPNISGGLGTACYGIVSGFSACRDVHVTFVIPKAYGNEQSENVQLISAENIPVGSEIFRTLSSGAISFVDVPSKLVPYLTPESFSEKYQFHSEKKELSEVVKKGTKIAFSGKYGPNLFDEINKYAIVAKTIAQENQFDLIHAHDWLTFPAAVAAKKNSGKPLVIHVHSTDFDRSGGAINPAIFAIEKQGMDEADQIITVSNLTKKRLVDQYQIPSKKITTVYNAIEPETNSICTLKKQKHKEKIVTFLGRITIQKGPEYFVDVARMVIGRMKNVHFVMAGSGELRDKIVELCVRHGISDRFHFTGFLKGIEVTRMLRKSDLFIMPSVSEPFGIVPLEAMQANVPIIISRQSGVAELIKNAVKTDFWDVHAMADAVHAILKYKKLAKTLTLEGKTEVDNLNWENSAREIRQVYMNTLNKKAS